MAIFQIDRDTNNCVAVITPSECTVCSTYACDDCISVMKSLIYYDIENKSAKICSKFRREKVCICYQPPNALICWAIRAIHLLSHVFEYWLWRNRYFWSKVIIWNVNCARITSFIFDTITGVLVKVSKFWDRKRLDLRGTLTPNLRIHVECSNLLSYQSQTLAVPWFWILAMAV